MWIEITEDNIWSVGIGEKLRYNNGYEWAETIADAFILNRRFIPTGVHNETAALLNPMFGDYVYVWREPEMDYNQSREYLIKEGFDPDEIANKGVLFVKQLSLLTKIKLAVYDVNTDPIERVLIIKGLIQEYESKQ